MSEWIMPDPVPLRTARAWALSRDVGFSREIHNYPGLDLNGLAPLEALKIALCLETAMLEEGCIVEQASARHHRVTASTAKARKRETAPLVDHVMKPGYAGRFATLTRAYEAQRTDAGISDRERQSVLDFLLNRLADVEREMLSARLPMEDASGCIPAALVRRASIHCLSGEFVDPDGNVRTGVAVDRSRLIERFPAERSEERHPEWPARLAEAGRRPRLPDRAWLRLQEATTFAYYGVAFSSRVDSLLDLSAIDETLRELRYPSIYGSIDVEDGDALDRAELEFNKRLSEAGLAGGVKFRAGGADIPIHCFLNIRDFSIVDDTIRPKLSDSYREIDPELRDVMVERKGFISWLRENYPQLCEPALGSGSASNLQHSPAKTSSGGRSAEHDEQTFNSLLTELFKNHGPLSSDDPDWNAKAKVVAELDALFQKRRPKAKVPGDTWLKGAVGKYLAAHPELDGRKRRKPI